MTAAPEIVLDASALIRGLQREDDDAVEVLDRIVSGETRAHAPDLIASESTNALLGLVRAGRETPSGAEAMLEAVDALPLVRHPTFPLARLAFARALDAGLSAYDGVYAVLSETLELPLVTADRRLAGIVERAILVGGG